MKGFELAEKTYNRLTPLLPSYSVSVEITPVGANIQCISSDIDKPELNAYLKDVHSEEQWNDATLYILDSFIEFKKGLNGRADRTYL